MENPNAVGSTPQTSPVVMGWTFIARKRSVVSATRRAAFGGKLRIGGPRQVFREEVVQAGQERERGARHVRIVVLAPVADAVVLPDLIAARSKPATSSSKESSSHQSPAAVSDRTGEGRGGDVGGGQVAILVETLAPVTDALLCDGRRRRGKK